MRGLGQIAELCAIARPDVGARHRRSGRCTSSSSGRSSDVARANAEPLDGAPPGGIAVVPADEPLLEPYLARDDIDDRGRFDPAGVARRGARWRFARRRPRRSSSTLPFTARHLAENVARRAHRLRRARPAARPGAGGRERDRALAAGAGRCASCPAAASSSTTPTTRTPPRCARRSSTSPSARATGVASRSSARWPSSATRAPRYHDEIGDAARRARDRARRRRRRARPRRTSAAARAAAVDPRRGGVRRHRRPPPARRRDPRQGVPRGGARRHPRADRETLPGMVRVLVAGLVAMVIAVAIGPTFIEWLRRNGRSASTSARRAPRVTWSSRGRRRWAAS